MEKSIRLILRRRTRGATLLLVLAMLAILFLIGAAMSFTTRMESRASANFAELTQARESVITGLPAILPLVQAASLGVTATVQPWSSLPPAWAEASKALGQDKNGQSLNSHRAELAKNGMQINTNADGTVTNAPQTQFRIADLSGRLNLNAVRSEKAMARVLENILPGSRDVQRKAKALYAMRGGDDTTTASERLDLRRPEPHGKRRIENLTWLRYRGSRNGQPLFLEDELRTASNFLTVYSAAPELMNFEDAKSVPKISVHDLSAEVIYAALKQAFPEKDERLLMQYAANLEDFSDSDSVPTIVAPTGAQPNPRNAVFGAEQTPLITEVYSDSATPVTNGDEGQYLEIFNPWDDPINVDGWSIKVNGSKGVGLTGTIQPNGYLIITDNYDKPSDDSLPETGSFLSIFGAAKNEGTKRVRIAANFDLPDQDAYVTLEDNQGHLLDAFAYGNTGGVDGKTSFQREDPLLRACKTAEATPFEHSGGASSRSAETSAGWGRGNGGLSRVTDVLRISTAYTGADTAASTFAAPMTTKDAHPWQTPLLSAPTEGQSLPTNLDLRVLDLFTEQQPIPVALPADVKEAPPTAVNRALFRKTQTGYAQQVAAVQSDKAPNGKISARGNDTTQPLAGLPLIRSFGKLNLNTCSKLSLAALEADDTGREWASDSLVEKFEAYRLERIAQKKAPFTNVSEFVAEFFPSLTAGDLDKVGQILEQVTVGSNAFEIVAENRREAETGGKTENGKNGNLVERKAARSMARWVISTDAAPYSLINFTLTP